MSRLPGIELSRCHSFLSDLELESISTELTGYISELRSIPNLATATPTTISNTLGKACRDPRVRGEQPVGPFPEEASFSQMIRFSDHPSRRNHKIVFTHADLNPPQHPRESSPHAARQPTVGSDGYCRQDDRRILSRVLGVHKGPVRKVQMAVAVKLNGQAHVSRVWRL